MLKAALILIMLSMTNPNPTNPKEVRHMAYQITKLEGYTKSQWHCLDQLIYRESRWKHDAKNGIHYGIGQMANQNPKATRIKQITQIIKYIKHRYPSGLACQALAHSYRRGWY